MDVEQGGTMIAQGTTIIGVVEAKEPLLVCGNIEGKVFCEDVVLQGGYVRELIESNGRFEADEDSVVYGDIVAQQIYNNGKVKGTMMVEGMLSLGDKAIVIGEVIAGEVEIERGAILQGNLMIHSSDGD